ncbi:MAG: M42 family peptidase [Clostridia bacterium]|nr:M42 family peptidase [Clostridia bacterium]
MNFELVKELCTTFGPSGRERKACELIKSKMENFCEEIVTDKYGNLFCKRTNNKNLKNVVLDAHTDTVGLIVTEVCKNGFLKFSALGGIDARVLPASEVTVHGKKDISGVIASKPPHLMNAEDKKSNVKIENMFIDTGISDIENYVSVGDVVTYRQRFDKMGKSIVGTYLDDRACCSAIIEIFENLKDIDLPYNLIASFSVREELGMTGARYQDLNPDVVIALDVTFGKTPDESRDLAFDCGKGNAIGFGPSLNKKLYDIIKNCTIKNNIPYQTEVLEGSSGTNAWAYQINKKPAVCGLISLPIKFMHTPVETASIADYDNLVDLTTCVLKNLSKEQLESLTADRILR